VLQDFGKSIDLPIGLSQNVRDESIQILNQVLADTMMLRDLYKKHHWQVSGQTFYQLHLLFDKHYQEQAEVVDTLAERIQLLGGISIAMAADVAELTTIERPPRGREEVPVQVSRLLRAHETIMKSARAAAKLADDNGDPGTNDVLISDLLRLNELQTWFLAEHLVDCPPIRSDEATPERAGTRSTAVVRSA
jgi:starvation-inducible DNA-binding protein